ncbi:hypothetical protein [Rhizobium yanglingense]
MSASSAPTKRNRTASAAVFEATDRVWMEQHRSPMTCIFPARAASWRCLSEHLCQGWLEGYLLTGRHGLFSCYEAFIHIVDSMFNQHAKWLKVTREAGAWRKPISLPQLPAHLACLAAGPQRLFPSGSGLRRSSSPTRRPILSASTCHRMPTHCSGSATIA